MSFKAFELVPVLEKIISNSSDKPKTIECLDCAAQNLFIGTSDCYVFHYIFDDTSSPLGRTTFQVNLQSHKHIGMKKPIQQVVTAAGINRLLVLCDGIILMFSMFELEFIPSAFREKLKGVTAIAKNDNPKNFDPFSVEIYISIGRKKSIHIYSVAEDKIIPIREISLPDPPIHMAADGGAVCVALGNQFRYCMVDAVTAKVQELFHFEGETTKPLLMRIGEEEFLLNGPTNAMGMFVTSEGTSQRAPLSWAESVQNLGYSFPYVVTLSSTSLTVHSIVSQDQKAQRQAITFKGGKVLLNYENKVFVCREKELYCLAPLPFKKQIQMLLVEKKVDEALQLAHVAIETCPGRDNDPKLLRQVQQQAGFVYLTEGLFHDALHMMREGGLDPRELISLFPALINSKWTFFPSRELHSIKDISALMKGSKTFMAEAKKFVLEYLEDARTLPSLYSECKEEVDSALLRLYAEVNSPKLLEIVSNENHCATEDSENCLMKYERYHARALFHSNNKEPDKALDFWRRIACGELMDPSFPGLEFVAMYLSRLQNYDLLWTHVPWLLEKNQELAVRVFTERPGDEPSSDRLQPDFIIDYLQRFPVARIKYLEFLVFEQKIQKEQYHTHLALLYLEEVFRLRRDPSTPTETITNARQTLRHMLEWSSLYRVALILSKIKEDSDLDAEAAALYGKMEQHNKALRILVCKLNDFSGAERYCGIYSKGKEKSYRMKLFHTLLSVYLQPGSDAEPFVSPAIKLLNSHINDFDTIEVIKLIPEEWSIGVLSQFLTGSVRSSLHQSRTSLILAALARGDNIKARAASIVTRKGYFTIYEDRLCQACRRPFNDSAVARYPNGVLTHVHCARNKHVCPVTGHVFSSNQS
ncbi:predicted protein [Nematostella vectensis]|uniref:CNH domain-containing protein n=1 Tax=Nematostella vectensis TaxID=45351 RepID=A7S1S5_NEMVE|nr:predicted protein [Nematostella vectensis]|eukprot:XP_001634432.1 predicted protein [Nematostella vectensis]